MATTKKTTTAAEAFESLAINPESLKEGYEKFTSGVSEFADLQKASLDAVMTSAGAFTKGCEKAASEQSAFTKECYEDSVSVAKAAAASKSIQEAFEIQSDYVRKSFERNLEQYRKMADLWTGVSKEVSAPVTEQYSQFVEKVQTFRP